MATSSISEYPKYKNSETSWLGLIPNHWNARRLGTCFTERRTKVSDKDYPPLSVTMKGIVPQLDTAAKTDAGDNRKLVRRGDFVINSRSDRKGSAGVSELDGSVSLISIVMEPRDIDPGFAHYLLRSQPFQEEFYRWGKGIVADLWSTNASEMQNILIPVLAVEEQKKIAQFLDYETARIDTLIARQKKLIALLKEKRQAVISHAVTKGLNPDAKMKDSGVEWLGEIPAHWKLGKLGYFVRIRGGQVDPRLLPYRNYILIAPNHIESRTGVLFDTETAEEQGADSGKYLCQYGDVIYSKIRPALAKLCMCPEDNVLCSADMYAMYGVAGCTNKYLYWSLLSDWFTSLVVLESDRVAMPKVNREKLNEIDFVVPPIGEQVSIDTHISITSERFRGSIEKCEEAIALLSEKKSSLISAAVTGKIDVRNWQSPSETKEQPA